MICDTQAMTPFRQFRAYRESWFRVWLLPKRAARRRLVDRRRAVARAGYWAVVHEDSGSASREDPPAFGASDHVCEIMMSGVGLTATAVPAGAAAVVTARTGPATRAPAALIVRMA